LIVRHVGLFHKTRNSLDIHRFAISIMMWTPVKATGALSVLFMAQTPTNYWRKKETNQDSFLLSMQGNSRIEPDMSKHRSSSFWIPTYGFLKTFWERDCYV
jgi:hypothetical protein